MVTRRAKYPVRTATRRLLAGLALDAAGQVRGEIAITLAESIDTAPEDTSRAALAAAIKELRAILLELVPSTNDAGRSFIESLFTR